MTGTSPDTAAKPFVLPYTRIVEQVGLRRALEIAYVSPAVGGVLATGRRGTAKSTTVRAFARMVFGQLPVTLPIGATDDRVIGGWKIDKLLQGEKDWQDGLIQEAGGRDKDGRERTGMLYIDEVNLLEDHLVNIILDAAATGILTVERDGVSERDIPVSFNLVGTMNPEEGGLRPQLLDRFGLVVWVDSAGSREARADILTTVLDFERLLAGPPAELEQAYEADRKKFHELGQARDRVREVVATRATAELAGAVAAAFKLEGHRGDLAMLRAAIALAAIDGSAEVRPDHLAEAAPLTLVHRRGTSESGTLRRWSEEDDAIVERAISAAS
jgi:magnesium chelatase subunit I